MKRIKVQVYIKRMWPAIVLCLLTIILSIAGFHYVMHYERDRGQNTFERAAEKRKDIVEYRIEDSLEKLDLLAETMEQSDVEQYDEILAQTRPSEKMDLFHRVDIIYPNNLVTMEDGQKKNALLPFDTVVEAGEGMSDLATDSTTGEQVWYYRKPVVQNGETIAVLLALVNQADLDGIAGAPASGGMEMCFLANQSDGTVLTADGQRAFDNFYSLQEEDRLKDYEGEDLKQDVENQKTGTVMVSMDNHQSDICVYYMPLKECSWEVLVAATEKFIYADVQQWRVRLLKGFLIEIVILCFYFVWSFFYIKDKLKKEMELEKQNEFVALQQHCAKEFTLYEDAKTSLERNLQRIREYYKAEHIGIFEWDESANEFMHLSDYGDLDWEKEQPLTEGNKIAEWLDKLQKRKGYGVIQSGENRKNVPESLQEKVTQNAIVFPLSQNGKVIGFVYLENAKEIHSDISLTAVLCYFVQNGLTKSREEEKTETLEKTDILTGVYNRKVFGEVLDEYMKEKQPQIGIACFRLEGLRKKNYVFGHEAGDTFLRKMAQLLEEAFPQRVYRTGNAEFTVILRNISESEFEKKAEQAARLIRQEGIVIFYGCAWKEENRNMRTQLKEADEKMRQLRDTYQEESKM